MRAIWLAELPHWEKGRAIGRLLEQLVRSRPDDWKALLHLLDVYRKGTIRLQPASAVRAGAKNPIRSIQRHHSANNVWDGLWVTIRALRNVFNNYRRLSLDAGDPYGIRTRISAVKGPRPNP